MFSPWAHADLHGLFDYPSERFGVTNAERYVGGIEDACLSLSTMPNRETARPDLRPGLRTMGFRHRVTIAFHVNHDAVSTLRILNGGRTAAFGVTAASN